MLPWRTRWCQVGDEAFLLLSRHDLSAVAVDLNCRGHVSPLRYVEFIAQDAWGCATDLRTSICHSASMSFGDVDLDSGQLVVLLLLKPQAQPVAGHQKAFVAVHVEPLEAVPAAIPTSRVRTPRSVSFELVWRTTGRTLTIRPRGEASSVASACSGFAARQKRVPRRDLVVIHRYRPASRGDRNRWKIIARCERTERASSRNRRWASSSSASAVPRRGPAAARRPPFPGLLTTGARRDRRSHRDIRGAAATRGCDDGV